MDRQSICLQAIHHVYPDLQVTSMRLITRGQNSDILIINESYVFRFPRYPHLIEFLKVETDILHTIQASLPLPVPNPEFIHLEGQPVGQAFMGYAMIPGEALSRDTFHHIGDDGALDTLAEQLAGFLQALHTLPVERLFNRELPVYETYQEYQDMYNRIQEKLFTFMRTDAQRWVSDHFETFLGNSSNFIALRALRHGDFGTTNLLFDSVRQRITGIIDFSSAGLGDPAVDFAGLLSSYGESFLERCLRFYPQMADLLPRVHFYRGIFALEEALFGIENGDEGAFRAGIVQYV